MVQSDNLLGLRADYSAALQDSMLFAPMVWGLLSVTGKSLDDAILACRMVRIFLGLGTPKKKTSNSTHLKPNW
jgi:hypothetical protein